MQLRHIRPGSVDWYDALLEEEEGERLSPDQAMRLRTLLAVEEAEVVAFGKAPPRFPVNEAPQART
jgi:hypothetical protein